MKKILIAPDSFKGTMTAGEICALLSRAVKELSPGRETVCIPMSDGGEGMVEAYTSLLGGEKGVFPVTGPREQTVNCPYGILPGGVGVLEMAGAAGLPLMGGEFSPLGATTYGVGEAIQRLADRGCRELLMGLGGSATNDCGIGMAAALGYRFLDKDGAPLAPYAFHLGRVEKILPPDTLPELTITAACDVNNPLCGVRGAAAVFGPQKGLKPEEIGPHDMAMAHFAEVIRRDLGADVAGLPGAGAAGGLGAGMMAFLGARLTAGIELLLDTVRVDDILADCDLVLTGEGRMDGQSIAGKVPVGVAHRAKKAGVPCVALCGSLGREAELVLNEGITAYFAATDGTKTMDELVRSCRDDLYALALRVLPAYL